MTWYELWLFLHITAMIVWVGGGLAVQVFGLLTKRAGDPKRTVTFARDVSWTAMWVFMPSAAVVFLSGVALMVDGDWGWDEPFLVISIVGFAGISAVAFGFLGPELRRIAAALEAEGPSPAIFARLGTRINVARVLSGLLLAIVFVMVVKPGT
jgi:uncharacterized membrane protein